MNCGIHAREWVSPATCMYIAKQVPFDNTMQLSKTNPQCGMIIIFITESILVLNWTSTGQFNLGQRKPAIQSRRSLPVLSHRHPQLFQSNNCIQLVSCLPAKDTDVLAMCFIKNIVLKELYKIQKYLKLLQKGLDVFILKSDRKPKLQKT